MSVNAETHHFDRRTTDVNVAALSTRVGVLEGRVGVLEINVTENTRELHANTALTKKVHQNTEDIVDAVNWMAKFTRGVVWASTFIAAPAGALASILAVLKYLQ